MDRAQQINLKIFTVVMAVAVVAASLFLWKNQAEMFARYPKFEGIFWIYVATGLPILAGLAGIFFEKPWGFWLLVVASMAAFFLEIFSGFTFLKSARIPCSLALLAWLARPILTPKT